jgi:glucosamine--fructose-6-phosphate aminotransferase (isomerizing)
VAGPVDGLATQLAVSEDATIGIGHTRWATHGAPSAINAHPIVSCDGSVAIVHNGTIENWQELKEGLVGVGHKFQTDTDSEVISHLIEEAVSQGETFTSAFCRLPTQLKGTFAIVAIHRDYPCLLLVRRGSPLVVGVGETGYFPASDIPSFLSYTSRVLYLKESDCVQVDASGVHRLQAGSVTSDLRELSSLEVDLGRLNYGKGGHEHFMIKEILEQAGVLEQALNLKNTRIAELARSLTLCRRAFFVGAGTSYHSSLYAERCAVALGNYKVRAVVASEFDQFAPDLRGDDLVVLLSQSGETADTLSAGRIAARMGAELATITNSALSTMAKEASIVVPMNCGLEIAVAATKSYTAQLAAIVLTLSQSAGKGEVGVRAVQEAANSLYNLTAPASRELIEQVATDLESCRDIFLLGKGLQYITAAESALKLKEVAGIRAEAFYLGEMKHGPLALIGPEAPVLIYYGGPDYQAATLAASELGSRGARVYGIGPAALPTSTFHIRTEDIGLGLPICQVAPTQLLSYELACLRDMDPDRPRNLAKSVTVL